MTAPLSSSLFYDRAASAMRSLTAQSDALNTQIATGKKLANPSDDPVAYQRLRAIAVSSADDSAASANIEVAQGALTQADTALASMTTQLQRASELTLQAKNGTLSDTDRAAIAEELRGIAGALAALGNAKDTRGLPVFGGSATSDAVITNPDGSHTLANTATPDVPIGGGQSVQAGANASQVLGLSGGRNAIDMLHSLADALSAGGDTSAAVGAAMTDLSSVSAQVTDVQASLGARGARLDLAAAQLTTVGTDREAARSALEDTDVTEAITQLQKTMTVLQATQASFTKLSSLSLFDYLK